MAADRGSLRTVSVGLVPGGLVYGAGFGALHWVAFVSAQASPLPWIRGGLWLGVVFAGFGAVGALAGDLLAGRVRSPPDPVPAPR